MGYKIIKENYFEIAIASKSKALFDYLYLKFYRKSQINKEMIDELRLNLDEFTKEERREFSSFCKSTNRDKFFTLEKLLFN
jgi:hypothetical protein